MWYLGFSFLNGRAENPKDRSVGFNLWISLKNVAGFEWFQNYSKNPALEITNCRFCVSLLLLQSPLAHGIFRLGHSKWWIWYEDEKFEMRHLVAREALKFYFYPRLNIFPNYFRPTWTISPTWFRDFKAEEAEEIIVIAHRVSQINEKYTSTILVFWIHYQRENILSSIICKLQDLIHQ